MAYTTPSQVAGVLGDDYDGSRDLQPFIDSANIVVLRAIPLATTRGVVLSDVELEMIERWLAAHFYCQSDKPYQSKSTGGASASFIGQTGMGFDSTTYGQTALRLDYSGALVRIDKATVATGEWIGKPKSEQLSYRQRNY